MAFDPQAVSARAVNQLDVAIAHCGLEAVAASRGTGLRSFAAPEIAAAAPQQQAHLTLDVASTPKPRHRSFTA